MIQADQNRGFKFKGFQVGFGRFPETIFGSGGIIHAGSSTGFLPARE
jgi:hypothetical protein